MIFNQFGVFVAVLVIAIAKATSSESVRYDNYKVFKVRAQNAEQLDILNSLSNEYEFWKHESHVNSDSYIQISPAQLEGFKNLMKKHLFDLEETISNVQSLIDKTSRKMCKISELEWTNYYQLEDIYSWIDSLGEKYPDIVTVFDLPGNSYEGRPIRGLKISHKDGNPGIFIESNMHAREWISSATSTWIINELLTSGNGTVRLIAENVDWYFIPVLNPDGFVYSHTANRLWRKTRKPYDECIGADLNRNFDYRWKEIGSSSDPCSLTYAGPHPESEPETQALVKYFETIPKNKIKIYMSFHSFGQLVLTPWGHTNKEFPPNYDDMLRAGSGYANAAKRPYNSIYRYGASSVVLYPVAGASKEWAYGVQNISFTFTLELRDTGKFGFLLPPEQIIPTAEETFEGLIGLMNSLPKGYLKG